MKKEMTRSAHPRETRDTHVDALQGDQNPDPLERDHRAIWDVLARLLIICQSLDHIVRLFEHL